jgi:hypothetical protein
VTTRQLEIEAIKWPIFENIKASSALFIAFIKAKKIGGRGTEFPSILLS